METEAWHARAEEALLELQAYAEVMRFLGERYFQGKEVLFPDAAETLEAYQDLGERLINLHNDGLRFRHGGRLPAKAKRLMVDTGAIKARAAEAAEPLIKDMVALATAETYHLMGEQEAAAEAVLPLVAGSGSTASAKA